VQACPDYPYELAATVIHTADESLTPERLAFRLATERFRADLLATSWRVHFLDGRQLEGWLDDDDLDDLIVLVEGFRARIAAEGPTSAATDFKAAFRQIVDRSVSAAV
jgi:hypothetical protein